MSAVAIHYAGHDKAHMVPLCLTHCGKPVAVPRSMSLREAADIVNRIAGGGQVQVIRVHANEATSVHGNKRTFAGQPWPMHLRSAVLNQELQGNR